MNDASKTDRSPWRRLSGWGKAAVGVGALLLLIALFYGVENWRGSRAWNSYRDQLKAKGEPLDIAAMAPAAIPGEENFFVEPLLANSIYSDVGAPRWSPRPIFSAGAAWSKVEVARIRLVTNETGEVQTTLGQFTNATAFLKFVKKASGLKMMDDPRQGQILKVAQPVREIPLRGMPGAGQKALAAMLPGFSWLVESTAVENVFSVHARRGITVEDFFLECEDYRSHLETLQDAAEARPHAVLTWDTGQLWTGRQEDFSYFQGMSKFVCGHALAALLKGDSAESVRDLRVVARLIEGQGSGWRTVSALMSSAVAGVYLTVVEQGLRGHDWTAGQLMEIQGELERMNFPLLLTARLRSNRAGLNQLLAESPREGMLNVFFQSSRVTATPEELFLRLAPRGWILQNVRKINETQQEGIEFYDRAGEKMTPAFYATPPVEPRGRRNHTPYNLLAGLMVQPMRTPWSTVATRQVQVNEASIACALERFRLARGRYPEALTELGTEWVRRPGRDVFGHDLKYVPRGDGYLLYSFGVDGKDNGGTGDDIVWPPVEP